MNVALRLFDLLSSFEICVEIVNLTMKKLGAILALISIILY